MTAPTTQSAIDALAAAAAAYERQSDQLKLSDEVLAGQLELEEGS